MSSGKYGQAEILTDEQLYRLFSYGLSNSRNKALAGLCFFAALRISEARQLTPECAFTKTGVRDEIHVPKEITKGQLGTRIIPTHPSLAQLLETYYADSLHLLKLKAQIGNWNYNSFDKDGNYIPHKHNYVCSCGSRNFAAEGFYRGNIKYRCKTCKKPYCSNRPMTSSTSPSSLLHLDDFRGFISSSSISIFDPTQSEFLFPGYRGKGCLTLGSAFQFCDAAFKKLGIINASSHSFRRTCLTRLHDGGVNLRVIQEISGHRNLKTLQDYLGVSDRQKHNAISGLD